MKKFAKKQLNSELTLNWSVNVLKSNAKIKLNEVELTSYPNEAKKKLSPSEMCLICTTSSAVANG